MNIFSNLINIIGGNYISCDQREYLPTHLKQFIADSLAGANQEELIDYHVHLLGLGNNGSGCVINPEMQSWHHPKKCLSFHVYMSACGIRNVDMAEQEFLRQLKFWADEAGGTYFLLALDWFHDEMGKKVPELSEFYIPNEYTLNVTSENADRFKPTVSIHPYREDALEELALYAKRGVKIVKWLPNVQGMHPGNKKIVPFYEKMREYNMILLSHTGEEAAVEAKELQELGNPLHLRLPLECGVKVIAAHCGSLGMGVHPKLGILPHFELLDEIIREPSFEGLIFSDISALIQYNRLDTLEEILQRNYWHEHLVYGSDYPLPAVHCIIRLKDIHKRGMISVDEQHRLKELYRWNPLLFDQICKRLVHKGENYFPSEVFNRVLY